MTEIDAAALVKRIEQLECRLRRLKRLIGGAALAAVIALAVVLGSGGHVLAATEHSGIFRARAFEVVDANGVVRAALGLARIVHPGRRTASGMILDLNGPSGWNEAELSAGMGGAAFALSAPGTGSSIYAQTASLTSIRISGTKNEPSVNLGITPRGAGLSVQNASGAWAAFLGVALAPNQAANLELDSNSDSYAGRRLVLGSTEVRNPTAGMRTPESSITAFDKKGNVIARWPRP